MLSQKEVEQLLDKYLEMWGSLSVSYEYQPDKVALESAVSTLLEVLDFDSDKEYREYRENLKGDYNG
jgi:hypothetical protein